MASYDDFLPYVLPDVPGCAEIVAIQHIRNAVIDFCEKTLIVQTDLDPVTLIAGQADYDLEPPTNRLVTKVISLFYQNKLLKPTYPDEIPSATFYNSSAINADSRSDPVAWMQKDSTTFSVFPIPKTTESGAITIRAAIKPTRSSTTCDDIVFEDYAEAIASSAKARLMLTPNKAYFNPNLVATHNQLFLQGVNVARQRSSRGYTRANLSVKMVSI
ncbi:hypothetical protein UFOVP1304_37 [uncultured Caudovirales phage]|uniref:Uncharacterized protein n=1 Tax=uncultured Caudovirales phage TaxID=2100421 RepID=A0A6J5RIG4_9CAUD|nr:hypothetical protein UFOVP1304_37 [uncultured Caudovirales phage]